MNVQFLTAPKACQTAAALLRARKARNLDALSTLESQHHEALIDYVRGIKNDSDLDRLTAERQRLEALCHEDHTAVLEAIADRQEQLRLAAIRQANLLASYQRRVDFADRFNRVLAGSDSCDVQTMNWLKERCPGDLNTAAWWRFSTMMGEYDSIPKAKRPLYGIFCRCDEYVPEPLEH